MQISKINSGLNFGFREYGNRYYNKTTQNISTQDVYTPKRGFSITPKMPRKPNSFISAVDYMLMLLNTRQLNLAQPNDRNEYLQELDQCIRLSNKAQAEIMHNFSHFKQVQKDMKEKFKELCETNERWYQTLKGYEFRLKDNNYECMSVQTDYRTGCNIPAQYVYTDNLEFKKCFYMYGFKDKKYYENLDTENKTMSLIHSYGDSFTSSMFEFNLGMPYTMHNAKIFGTTIQADSLILYKTDQFGKLNSGIIYYNPLIKYNGNNIKIFSEEAMEFTLTARKPVFYIYRKCNDIFSSKTRKTYANEAITIDEKNRCHSLEKYQKDWKGAKAKSDYCIDLNKI